MRKGTCKHFQGTIQDKCEAGVVMRDLAGPNAGWFTRLPCLSRHATEVLCEAYAEPTDKELAEYTAAHEQTTANMRKMVPTIRLIKEGYRGQDADGTVECPVCGGPLHWTHAACNGHVWVRCMTDGCVGWME